MGGRRFTFTPSRCTAKNTYKRKHRPSNKTRFPAGSVRPVLITLNFVVEHMTQAHENLDKLSKRVEGQNLSVSASHPSPSTGATSRLHQSKAAIPKTLVIDRNRNSSGGRKDTQSPNVAAFPRFIPITSSQHKQMVPVASLRTSSSSSPLTSTATTLDGANPVSYTHLTLPTILLV